MKNILEAIMNNNNHVITQVEPNNGFLALKIREMVRVSTSIKKRAAFTITEGATHVYMPQTKAKLAFTLAEVLITLAIIGVVAAMTIPILMTNYRVAVTKSKLKKTISVMSQAAQMTKEKYDFDFSSLDRSYYDPVGGSCIDDPQKVKSFCSLFNASLSNATYLGYSKSLYNITPAATPKLVPYGTNGTSRHQAYILSDGVIVAIEMDIVPKNCELLVGEVINSDWITNHKACIGYIDVNGEKKPNKEVSCSNTTTEFKPNEPCFVKKDQTHLTDIYPVIFHDSMVEPATNAASFVLKN